MTDNENNEKRQELARRRTARLQQAWARKRAEGWTGWAPEERARITALRLASTRANRAAKLAAMSDEERVAFLREESARCTAASVRGWRTRRLNRGEAPTSRAPAATWIRVCTCDADFLRTLADTPLHGLQLLVERLKAEQAYPPV